jgi:hypothetical protein
MAEPSEQEAGGLEARGLEARVWALEMLVAFLFAAQHMQTPDPAAAVQRLKDMLIDRAGEHDLPEGEALRAAVLAELERAVGRAEVLQGMLPRRLVD